MVEEEEEFFNHRGRLHPRVRSGLCSRFVFIKAPAIFLHILFIIALFRVLAPPLEKENSVYGRGLRLRALVGTVDDISARSGEVSKL